MDRAWLIILDLVLPGAPGSCLVASQQDTKKEPTFVG